MGIPSKAMASALALVCAAALTITACSSSASDGSAKSTSPTALPASTTSAPPPETVEGLKVVVEEDPTLPNHTIYRPADLDKAPGLPIVVWGESACSLPGGTFKPFLSELASHGYLVIADLPLDEPGKDTSEVLLEGVTWATAEATRTGSKYDGHLDTTKVAAMGHSCGGLLALHVGGDPRISTVVAWDSGIIPDMAMGEATKADLTELHGPTMWVNTGPSDIAYANARKDFAEVPDTVPAVWANYDLTERGDSLGGAHMGTYMEPLGGAMTRAGVDWLDFTLKGDERAGESFIGPCHLCSEPKWTVESKNWD